MSRAQLDVLVMVLILGGHAFREDLHAVVLPLRVASNAKAVIADMVARPAASQTGEPASRPIFIIGQVRPNSTIVATSCSHATRVTRGVEMVVMLSAAKHLAVETLGPSL